MRDRPLYVLIFIFIVVALLIAAGYIKWSESPMAYNCFLNRNRDYYIRVSGECDNLISRIPAGASNRWMINGDSIILPPVLRGLHAQFFDVETNRVFVSVGAGRAGYGIIWEPNDEQPSNWELKTDAENLVHVVYSIQK